MTSLSARLRTAVEHQHEKAIRRRKALEWAGEKVATVRGTAVSDDRNVRATVDPTGMLTGLELTPEALRDLGNTELARLITSVAQRATADARNQVRDTYQGLVDEGTIRQLPANLPPAPAVEPDRPARPEPAADDADGEPHSWLRDDYY
jgi:hypothetical protein